MRQQSYTSYKNNMQSPVKLWRNQKSITSLVGLEGVVETWTIIRVPPAGFSDQAPYAVVLVRLETGQSFEAQLVDSYKDADIFVEKGMRVRALIRRVTHPDHDGVIAYGIKVRPI